MCMMAEGKELYDLLKYQAKKMERHLEIWLDKVKEERNKFNELNYFTTPQLLILREELGQFEASTLHSPPIKQGVMNLLYGITDSREVQFIKERLNEVNSKPIELDTEQPLANDEDVDNNENQESASGDSQSNAVAKTVEQEAKPKAKRSKSRKIKEEVNSHWPKPKLKREDLNKVQLGYYIELEESGFDKLLILFALETCPPNSELEDIMTWCDNEKDNYTYPSSESESSSDEEMDIDEEFSETQNLAKKDEATNTEEEEPLPIALSSLSSKNTKETQEESHNDDINEGMETAIDEMLDEHFENMIEVKERVPLDKNHQDVKILTDAGYEDLEKVIEALTIFPDDIARAEDYLQKIDLEIETNTYTTQLFARQQSVNQSTEQDSQVKE